MEHAKGAIYELLEVGVVCNNAIIDNETLLGQPTEGALLAAAMKVSLRFSFSHIRKFDFINFFFFLKSQHGMYGVGEKYLRLHEQPFNSENKMMAVKVVPKYSDNKEEIFFVKGALEKILQQCKKYRTSNGVVPLNVKKEQDFLAEAFEIGRKGLRGKSFLFFLHKKKIHFHFLIVIFFTDFSGCSRSWEFNARFNLSRHCRNL